MHGLKETLKKILSVSNFKCKERKKNYTRDDGGGVQLTLYVWRELGLEKIQLHTAVRVTACVQCVHFVRSTSRN